MYTIIFNATPKERIDRQVERRTARTFLGAKRIASRLWRDGYCSRQHTWNRRAEIYEGEPTFGMCSDDVPIAGYGYWTFDDYNNGTPRHKSDLVLQKEEIIQLVRDEHEHPVQWDHTLDVYRAKDHWYGTVVDPHPIPGADWIDYTQEVAARHKAGMRPAYRNGSWVWIIATPEEEDSGSA